MNRLLPRTLVGQMILILLGGLVVSHLVVGWLYSTDRQQAVRAITGYAATQRIANLARLIDEAPEEWRGRIIAAASDPTLRVTLSAKPPISRPGDEDAQVQNDLADQLSEALASRLRMVVGQPQAMPFNGFGHQRMMMNGGAMMGGSMHRPKLWRSLAASFQLTDGQYLTFTAILPESAPATSWQFPLALIAMSAAVAIAVGQDGVYQYITPTTVFWIRFCNSVIGAGAISLKTYLSTSFADSQKPLPLPSPTVTTTGTITDMAKP